MSVFRPVSDRPVQILDIYPARKVDDEASTEGLSSTREYNVITNGSSTELTVEDVYAVEPLFIPGRVYGARQLESIRLTQTESDTLYILEAEFVPYIYKTPFFEPIEWEWESAILEIPAYVDVDGKPIVTTAGEPIIGLTRKLKLWNIRGTRNVSGVPKWFRDYGFSVNSDNVTLDGQKFKKNELQLQRLSLGSWDSQTIEGTEYRYRPLSFEFWFNPLTWSTEVLNMGFNELVVKEIQQFDKDGNAIEGKTRKVAYPVRATNGTEPTTSRVFLNKTGQRPRDNTNTIKQQLAPSDIVVLKFDLEEKLPYSVLVK